MIFKTETSTLELFHGDCLELMRHIPENSVDLILTDLPYGITNAPWDKRLPLDKLWELYNAVLKDNGIVALFAIQPFTTQLINSNLAAYRYSWYWLKQRATGAAYARYQPMRRIEEICVFYRKKGTYNPQGLVPLEKLTIRRGSTSILFKRNLNNVYVPKYTHWPVNVLEFKKDGEIHSAQKPLGLLEYLVKTYTNENETILDSCMGSGSTGMAVRRAGGGRKFIGIEKDDCFLKKAYEWLVAQEKPTNDIMGLSL